MNFPDVKGISASSKAIQNALVAKKNFSVIAGAGSGKTGALVKALLDIRELYGRQFRERAQRVACITYTNVAVDVIQRRTNADELFYVSTIHGFLWSLIEQFGDDLRRVLKEVVIPARIAKKREDDNGGASKKAQAARASIARLEEALVKIDSVDKIKYDVTGRRSYSKGQIDHDDVIDIASVLLDNTSVLQKIVSQRFPIILVDEAQDTFASVIRALNSLASQHDFPLIGYFGDPMQQIYEKRTGSFEGPPGTEVIKIRENYRCSRAVITFLNRVRTDIEQIPGDENVEGSVGIILIATEDGRGIRKSYDEAQLTTVQQKFDKALASMGWNGDLSVKSLFLTRQMIAQRLGFADLNRLFTGDFSSKAAEDNFKDGTHFLLEPFLDILIPAIEAKKAANGDALTKILLKASPLLWPNGKNKHSQFGDVVNQMLTALDALEAIWDKGSIREILDLAASYEILELRERLEDHLKREPRAEKYDEAIFGAEREDWLADAFFGFKIGEVARYRDFVHKQTRFSTQHGVKGDEFDKVLVVFDDTEANWSSYSFSKVFIPKTVGANPTEGQAQRTRNLSYVCFSRARCDLRIMLFTKDVLSAKKELTSAGLFSEDQITILE